MREKKNDIKYLIPLNDEQKKAKAEILDSVASAVYGAAGSGKSLLAAQIALDQLFLYGKKIVIVRPAVTAHEDIGYLKGSADEKMALFTQPTHQNMYKLYNKAKIDKEITDGNYQSAAGMLNAKLPPKLFLHVPWTEANMKKFSPKVKQAYEELLASAAAAPAPAPAAAASSGEAASSSSSSPSVMIAAAAAAAAAAASSSHATARRGGS